MTTIRVSSGEFRIDRMGGTAALVFHPSRGNDVIIPGLAPADLELIGAMMIAQGSRITRGIREAEPVQVRFGGAPEAVARAAELLATAHGITPGPMGTKLRHQHLAQGYLTAVIEMAGPEDPRPAAELSTDQLRDEADHRNAPGGAHR